MQFRLAYEGPLPAEGKRSSSSQIKHEIRKKIHSQLLDLYSRNINFRVLVMLTHGDCEKKFSGFTFIPLVVGSLHMVCELDILFLRRERPGALLTKPRDEYGGDLDNRLKIFLDALRVPREAKEVPRGITPEAKETPFYCLLEDDALITKFQVESDTLLGRSPSPENKKDVHLIVRVTTKLTQVTENNISLI
jgi:hypothetical protein